jgi:5'-deoxynucleotidase YfbR-like HD superfamily hydrolase
MSKDYSQFYEDISVLAHIPRYSNVPRITSESVAEHSFFVAALVVKLHEEYTFNLERALTMAVVHDWGEVGAGDITVATKRRSYALSQAAHQVEEDTVATMLSPDKIEIWFEYEEQSTVESRIVKLADIMQCIQYATMEVRLGNEGYMRKVLNESIERRDNLLELLKGNLR